jgi:hypothetical protein
LVLDGAGFCLQGGLIRSPRKISWRDVEEFYVWRLPRGGVMVGYRYRVGATNVPRIVKFNRSFGADGALPRSWPMGTNELVAELNAYRERATQNDRS